MTPGRKKKVESRRVGTPVLAPGRSGGYLGRGEGFRRNSQAINGQLTGILCAVSRAGVPVLGEEAACG